MSRAESVQPSVTALMVTRNRPSLRERALKCFDAQTYANKSVLILDTSDGIGHDLREGGISVIRSDNTVMAYRPPSNFTIGELRNMALGLTTRDTEIVIHLDDDDWSHPNRIAEQVVLLQSSGADCVGYREMLFWKQPDGEAWLYSNRDPRYCLGTSLCYWRKTWERKPFEATSQGDDHLFTLGLKCVSVTSIFDVHNDPYIDVLPNGEADKTPRMIARIHAGNTSNAYDPADMRKASEWKRVPEWDSHARWIMEGK